MSENMQQCPSCGELVPMEYVMCVWCGYDLTAEHIRRAGISIGTKEAISRMKETIVDPMNSLKKIALLPDTRGPRIIFYVIGLVMTFNMITLFSKLEGLPYEELPDFISTTSFGISYKVLINLSLIILQPLLFLLIFEIIWRLSSRILSLLSRSVGGKGDQDKIKSVIGYSMLPVLIGWTLAWLIRLITPAESVSSGANYQEIESALISVAEEGIGLVGVIFIWIGWIWALVLGIIGMRHAGKLSWVEAVLVAGIPYAFFISIVL